MVSVVPSSPTHPPAAIAPGSWFAGDAYPPEAARKGIEGSVRFEVNVDATGKPTACRVVQSSKSDLLDQATCQIVMAKGRFIPAALNGKPVAGTFQTNAVWRLEGPTGPASGYVAAIVDFSKDDLEAFVIRLKRPDQNQSGVRAGHGVRRGGAVDRLIA